MVPLASVLAMQQVATANQQNQSNKSSSETATATNIVHQIDGFPPDISSEALQQSSNDDVSGHSEENQSKHSEKDVSLDDGFRCGEDPVVKSGTVECDESSPHCASALVMNEENDSVERGTSDDVIRTAETPPTDGTACKKKNKKLSQGFPPGVLGKLLRQQRRRKRQGKVGGIPVEVIVQLDGGSGGGGKGGGKSGVGGDEGEGSSSENDSEDYGDSSDEEEVDQVSREGGRRRGRWGRGGEGGRDDTSISPLLLSAFPCNFSISSIQDSWRLIFSIYMYIHCISQSDLLKYTEFLSCVCNGPYIPGG